MPQENDQTTRNAQRLSAFNEMKRSTATGRPESGCEGCGACPTCGRGGVFKFDGGTYVFDDDGFHHRLPMSRDELEEFHDKAKSLRQSQRATASGIHPEAPISPKLES